MRTSVFGCNNLELQEIHIKFNENVSVQIQKSQDFGCPGQEFNCANLLCKTAWGKSLFTVRTHIPRGPGSPVGIATDYGLDGPGIKSRWGLDFPPVQTGPGAHPASCTMSTGSFPGMKCGRGVLLTIQPLPVPWSWKSRSLTLAPSGPQPGL